jgi:6-phosphogluconolactonase
MSDYRFNNTSELDKALASFVSESLASDINAQGTATLVVSGGSTPKGLFAKLSYAEINWAAITVLLADDRWVPLNHPDSNETMVRQTLLVNNAAQATFMSLVGDYPNADSNLLQTEALVNQLPAFSVVVLGMGNDMHTASLFPCSAQIDNGLATSNAVLMTHPTTAPHARVSLSQARLLRTQRGLVHIVGDDKWQVLEQARASESEQTAPISAFVNARNAFDVWWAPKN